MTTIEKQQEVLEQFVKALSPAMHDKWYLVGGALVNWYLLDRPAKDLDIVVCDPWPHPGYLLENTTSYLENYDTGADYYMELTDADKYPGARVLEIGFGGEVFQLLFPGWSDIQSAMYEFPIPITRMAQDLTLPPDDRNIIFGNLDPGADALYRGNVITIPDGTRPEYAQRYIDKFAGTKYTVVVEDTPF